MGVLKPPLKKKIGYDSYRVFERFFFLFLKKKKKKKKDCVGSGMLNSEE